MWRRTRPTKFQNNKVSNFIFCAVFLIGLCYGEVELLEAPEGTVEF